MTDGKGDRLWTFPFVTVIGVAVFSFIAVQGLNSGTSVYLSLLGFPSTLAGIGVATFSLTAAVVRLASGVLVDRLGRARLMVIGDLVLVVGILGFSLSSHAAAFIFWRFVQGIGLGASTTIAATAATEILPHARLGEGIGYYGLGQALAFSIGPALALFLVATNPAENLYYGLAVSAAIAFLFALMCRYEKNPAVLPRTSEYRRRWEARQVGQSGQDADAVSAGIPGGDEVLGEVKAEDAGLDDAKVEEANSVEETLADAPAPAAAPAPADAAADADAPAAADAATEPDTPTPADAPTGKVRGFFALVFEAKVLAGALPMLAIAPVFSFGITFIGLLGTSIGVGAPGVFYTVAAVVMIAVRLSSGRFMDKVIAIRIITVAVAAGIIAFLLILSCTVFDLSGIHNAPFYVASLFYGVCLGLAMPTNQTVAVRNTPAERWGQGNALFLLCNDLGIGIASMVWGAVTDNFGFSVTICCVLAFLVIAFVVSYLCYPAREKHSSVTASEA